MQQVKLPENKKTSHYAVRESIKTIRTNLQFCAMGCRVILITSCLAHEGKTTVTIELARSLTEIGKRVLVLDADLRKATIMRRASLEGSVKGLSQYLSGQATAEEIICSTQYDGFDIAFAGQCPPNPAELVGSSEMQTFLQTKKEEYDYVLVDTPPVGVVIDAAVLASHCDGAVMVLSLDETGYKEAGEAKAQLEKSGCRIVGAIVNEARQNRRRGFVRKIAARFKRKAAKNV